MIKILQKTFLLFFILHFTSAFSQKLPEDSAEYKQLLAIGYELDQNYIDLTDITVMSNGDALLNIQKSELRTVIWRSFIRKKLEEKQEYELLKYVNKVNQTTAFQVSISDDRLEFAIYLFGPHNTRSFAAVIRMIEKVYDIVSTDPEFENLIK